MTDHASHLPGRRTQGHLRGGATTAVAVNMVNVTRDAVTLTALAAEAVEEEATASPEHTSALSLQSKTAAALSAH